MNFSVNYAFTISELELTNELEKTFPGVKVSIVAKSGIQNHGQTIFSFSKNVNTQKIQSVLQKYKAKPQATPVKATPVKENAKVDASMGRHRENVIQMHALALQYEFLWREDDKVISDTVDAIEKRLNALEDNEVPDKADTDDVEKRVKFIEDTYVTEEIRGLSDTAHSDEIKLLQVEIENLKNQNTNIMQMILGGFEVKLKEKDNK